MKSTFHLPHNSTTPMWTSRAVQRLTASSFLAALLCFNSGCASIVTGTHKKVAFNSSPQGAHVKVVNGRGKTVAEGTTPFTARLWKGKPYFMGQKYNVTFAKEGHWETTHQLKSTVNGWYLGNLIFGGLVGLLVVDPLTGAMYTLPKEVTVSLNPKAAAMSESPETTIVHLDEIPVPVRHQLVRVE